MAAFDDISIIYNPNSTGDSPRLARELHDAVSALGFDATLQETKRPGHAEELAYNAATSSTRPLVVSVSGDGGYHEVINGVLRAVDTKKATPICAVLPGGNANDHYSHVYDRPLLEAIQSGEPTKIDVLSVNTKQGRRYAHSYVGLGLTPLVAVELNKHDLSAVKEIWLAIRTFWKFRPFAIKLGGKEQTFDSIVLANIGIMAKHLTIDADTDVTDGKFELLCWPDAGKRRLMMRLFQAAFTKHSSVESISRYKFETINPMPMQLDGEILKLGKSEMVDVRCLYRKLEVIK
ncbi:MAG TPA: diacylglycerol kinase family protein [Candidatus Saccharimonadales bacterium]